MSQDLQGHLKRNIIKLEVIKLANKDLKNRHPFSNSLDNDLWKKFDELSKETGVNKSKLLDKAIELLLNEKESK